MDYTFSIGSGDPFGLAARDDADAIAQVAAHLRSGALDDLGEQPEAVATLLGPNGLVTRPSERLDEFLARTEAIDPAVAPDRLQPGDTNSPDCNGD